MHNEIQLRFKTDPQNHYAFTEYEGLGLRNPHLPFDLLATEKINCSHWSRWSSAFWATMSQLTLTTAGVMIDSVVNINT